MGTAKGMVVLSANARRDDMEISVIELVLRHAVQRGVLDADDVNAAVDRMWGAPCDVPGGYQDTSDKASTEGKQNG